MWGMDERRARKPGAFQIAVELVRKELAAGDQYAKDLQAKARSAGITPQILGQARRHLGGRAFQTTKEDHSLGPWMWTMAPRSPTAPPIGPPAEVPSEQPELEPVAPVLTEPEEIMAPTNEDISKALEAVQARLDGLEKRSVTVDRLNESVVETLDKRAAEAQAARASQGLEDVKKQVTDLEAKVQSPDPRLTQLAEKADTLVSLCELHPELCAHLQPAAEAAKSPKVPAQPKDAHEAILHAINEAGMETLGRTPTWGDLMDLCPGGDCSKGAVEAIGKRPALLKELVAQEGVSDVLIEALKESGKLVVEPGPAPAPVLEEVASGSKPGWFGRIPERQG